MYILTPIDKLIEKIREVFLKSKTR